MAKRTRGVGVRNPYRPGGGPPVRSTAPRSAMGRGAEPPAAIPGAPPRAADEPDLVASAVAATEATGRAAAVPLGSAPPAPTRSQRGRVKVKPDSLLAQRAADEYVYVGQDLRRIVIVAGILFAALIVLWLFFTIVDPFDIY